MTLAKQDSKLGLQKSILVPKSLKNIAQKAEGQLSLLDCIIFKRYPVFCSEYPLSESKQSDSSEKVRPHYRSVQSSEYLQDKFAGKSSFRIVFKLKVCDTLHRAYKAMVTFYNMTEETYDMLNPGDRISIVGAFLGKSKFNPDTL